jgi:TonB family protein
LRLTIQHFVMTSVLVHAAILVAWTSTPSQTQLVPAAKSSAPSFAVALQNSATQVNHAKPLKHTHETKKTEAKLVQQATNTPSPKTTAETTDSQRPVAKANAYPAELHRSQVRDRVLSRIRADLHQYFVYPLLARRQGWQGRVLLGFSVEANGMIHNIHVAAGSGYAILDTSAVDALSRVQHLYEVSNWLQGERLELQMPVVFRLQGG